MVNKKYKDSPTLTAEIVDDCNERAFYLAILNDAITNLHYKVSKGRIKDAKKEKLKIDMYRALFYGVNVANNVYKDKQIDNLESEFEKLKKGLAIKDSDKISGGDSAEISDAELNDLVNFDERIKSLKNNSTGGD